MRRLLITLVLLVVAGVAVAGTAERWLLYPLDPRHLTPADAGVANLTEHRIETPDGETLIVWAADPRPSKPVILYFQGNAGNLAIRAARFRAFTDAGYGVVAPAYRGSSGSTGTPAQDALERDAVLVFGRLKEWVDADTSLIFYGESLGTAVSTYLATKADPPPAALVLEAPFTSIPALVRHHYPQFSAASLVMSDKWPTRARIRQSTAPLLILHGAEDELIPTEMGRTLLRLSGSDDKKMIIVNGAGHNNVWQPSAKQALFDFLARF
ncbi:alpha/beta hydrolase [Aliiroseovarius sp. YM-037]|uniref:alpha/beta hydrolase n=1 Tax=Aliiroseovarius sp. YM-037 TaxID=3341728 RepID=UPI003A7FEF3C